MTYDIMAVKPEDPGRPEAALAQARLDEDPEAPDWQRSQEDEEIQARVVASMRARYPGLRHIRGSWRDDLFVPAVGPEMQLIATGRCVLVMVPAGDAVPEARKIIAALWEILEILVRDLGFVVYDEQLERFLDLESDEAASVAALERMMSAGAF